MHATAFLLLSLFAPAVLAAQQDPAPGARRSLARRNVTVGAAVLTQDGTDIALSWPTWHQAGCPSSAGSTDAKKCGGGSEANADLSLASHNDTAWAPAQRDDNFWNHLDSDWTSVGYRLTEAPDSYAIIEVGAAAAPAPADADSARSPARPRPAHHLVGRHAWYVAALVLGGAPAAHTPRAPGVDFGLEADGASIFAAMDFPEPVKAVPGTNASAGPWAPLPLASLNLQWTNDCGDQTYDFGVTAYFADGTNSTAAGQDQVSLSVPSTVRRDDVRRSPETQTDSVAGRERDADDRTIRGIRTEVLLRRGAGVDPGPVRPGQVLCVFWPVASRVSLD
jgi:hypothetical protein